ncbi:venom serine protease Bi-VSP [Zeugodacus cucurbitae]|uniref:venom serine protease Bi-VSP n=1 Tax=Zeugodacus cucurbitae TaxID=28588 RepID=UPI0023D8FC4B|nr:venom serine protease Bi-VSP [Zeugodacus cucurbitae]
MKTTLVLLILCSLQILTIKAQYNCVTPENYYGICSSFNSCPQIVSAQTARNQQYVAAAQRACGGSSFCCAQPQQRPSRQAVSQRPSNPLVVQVQQSRRAPATQPQQVRRVVAPQQQQQPQQQRRRVRQQPRIDLRGIFDVNEYSQAPSSFVGYRAGQLCNTPDNAGGVCIEINDCQVLLSQLYKRYTDPNFVQYVRASNRNCGGSSYSVCCPGGATPSRPAPAPAPAPAPTPAPSQASSAGSCGVVVRTYKKIVGGKASRISDWPWMALLAYPNVDPNSPFKCGGALVSSRHVVTAAHCIRNDLSYVRLGEYDLSTNTETQHQDLRVVKQEKHPSYNTANGRNDIGIVWLERDVQFTKNIKPICLPSSQQLRSKSYINYTPFVAGWGKTMEGGVSSNVLQELQIPILTNEVCRDSYQRARRLITADQFDTGVLCAGVLSGGKDTCQGDSGGPLMIPETVGGNIQFYLIGVVSYGVGCARPEIPGVYTSVQFFVDWILAKISS